MAAMDVIVYGSCVGRDTFSDLETRGHRLAAYIARQSVASIGNPIEAPLLQLDDVPSAFQRRMLQSDIAGDAFEVIKRVSPSKSSCLLWDLTDERCGFYTTPSGGVMTRSQEALNAGIEQQLPEDWLLHPFGSLDHRLRFIDAAVKFKDVLKELGIWEKSYVLAVPWAKASVQGSPTPTSYGFTAHHANEIFSEYYDFLEMDGWQLIRLKQDPRADDDHRWGLAPFHYTAAVYTELSDQIENQFNR